MNMSKSKKENPDGKIIDETELALKEAEAAYVSTQNALRQIYKKQGMSTVEIDKELSLPYSKKQVKEFRIIFDEMRAKSAKNKSS
ncbi:hypothetical protein HQ531_12155 [bacterium]|nr:hypothetical protein [bacterium]